MRFILIYTPYLVSLRFFLHRIGLGKPCYHVYNSQYEHIYTLILRKSYLRSKIQHRISEYEILDQNKTHIIGRICPFSTDVERSQYGQATSIKCTIYLTITSHVLVTCQFI